MTKQEKLLLIDCLRMSYICDPQECGHERDDENGWCKNCQDHYDALLYATECIEKQIPKQAKWDVQGNGWNDWIVYTCPVCGTEIRDAHVCPKCYQVIKSYKESENND